MKDIELPLSDLVELFSYDDKQGNPIVKIINFKTQSIHLKLLSITK